MSTPRAIRSLSPPRAVPRFRIGGLWWHRDFRLLWAGESVSLLGSQVTLLALPLVAAVTLRVTATQMGLLRAAEYLPFLLVTPFAGVLVDRVRRRPLLLVTNLGRALVLGMVPLLVALGWLSVAALLAIVAVTGVFAVAFELAYQSFMPSLVPPEDLTEGNSKLYASASVAEIGGPGFGGLLVQLVTAPFAILVDAASFLLSALTLATIQVRETSAVRTHRNVWREMGEGFRALRDAPVLRAFMYEAVTYNFFWNGITGVFVLYAVRVLGFTPGILGAILAVGGLGGLIGALLTPHAGRRWGVGHVVVIAAAIASVAMLALPLAARPGPTAVGLLAAVFFVNGVGVAACNVHTFTWRQAAVPDHLRGRMNAAYRTITYGAIPPGAALSGLFAERNGLYPALVAGAVGMSLAWVWVARPSIWRVRAITME